MYHKSVWELVTNTTQMHHVYIYKPATNYNVWKVWVVLKLVADEWRISNRYDVIQQKFYNTFLKVHKFLKQIVTLFVTMMMHTPLPNHLVFSNCHLTKSRSSLKNKQILEKYKKWYLNLHFWCPCRNEVFKQKPLANSL